MLLYKQVKRDKTKQEENEMYRRAIVDELGCVMFWCDELKNEQIECILDSHNEWMIKCIEL